MVPRARKNTTLDPAANPPQGLGEASPDPLSMAGGPSQSVEVESRAFTPSLFGTGPSPFTEDVRVGVHTSISDKMVIVG